MEGAKPETTRTKNQGDGFALFKKDLIDVNF